jgi:hypothetical protein
MPVTTITTLDTGASVTTTANYTIQQSDIVACSVTTSAYATAIGNLIHVISSTETQTIYYVPLPPP